MPTVLIVGGGFAGLAAARALADAPVEVMVVDRRNYHVFQPLLYQVATAALSPADITSPIRAILRDQKNCRVALAEVTGVDVGARRLLVRGGAVPYDWLVLAAGATHAYFGHDEWAALAPGLKGIEDATELVRASPLGHALGVPLDSSGRVIVGPDLAIPGRPEVFVVGDMAAAGGADGAAPVPGVAQAAIQMGRHVGQTIAREAGAASATSERTAFAYRDTGSMAVIGRAKAVVHIGRLRIGGFVGWILWGVVHILFLIGFRDRVTVLLSWLWNWLLGARDARLITGDARPEAATRPPTFGRDASDANHTVGLSALPPRARPAS